MTLFDFILIIIALCFGINGFALGFIQSVGGLVGLVLGVFLSGQWFDGMAEFIGNYIPVSDKLLHVICFIFLFVLIERIVGILFWFIGKIFNIISIIPFLKTINRLLGAALGLIEGVIAVGVLVYILSRYPFNDMVEQMMLDSKIANIVLIIAKIVTPLLPEAVKMLKSLI